MPSRRAFTLVELVATMGVIAVLMALLLPSLSKARQQAHRIRCQSNMRQLGQCVQMYTSEFQGQLPYCNWADNVDSGSGGYYGFGWLFAAERYRTAGGTAASDWAGAWMSRSAYPPDGVKSGVLWPYCGSLAIYHCPLDDPANRPGTESLTSYLFNGAQCGYGQLGSVKLHTQNVPGYKAVAFRHPAESVLMWEAMEQAFQGQSNTTAIWNDGASFPDEEVLADRHYHGADVLCIDGHVEWWSAADWRAELARRPGRLFCSPSGILPKR